MSCSQLQVWVTGEGPSNHTGDNFVNDAKITVSLQQKWWQTETEIVALRTTTDILTGQRQTETILKNGSHDSVNVP